MAFSSEFLVTSKASGWMCVEGKTSQTSLWPTVNQTSTQQCFLLLFSSFFIFETNDGSADSISNSRCGGFPSQELVVMGAPGSYYWTGTIKVYNLTSDSFYSPRESIDSHGYSYLGKASAERDDYKPFETHYIK